MVVAPYAVAHHFAMMIKAFLPQQKALNLPPEYAPQALCMPASAVQAYFLDTSSQCNSRKRCSGWLVGFAKCCKLCSIAPIQNHSKLVSSIGLGDLFCTFVSQVCQKRHPQDSILCGLQKIKEEKALKKVHDFSLWLTSICSDSAREVDSPTKSEGCNTPGSSRFVKISRNKVVSSMKPREAWTHVGSVLTLQENLVCYRLLPGICKIHGTLDSRDVLPFRKACDGEQHDKYTQRYNISRNYTQQSVPAGKFRYCLQ